MTEDFMFIVILPLLGTGVLVRLCSFGRFWDLCLGVDERPYDVDAVVGVGVMKRSSSSSPSISSQG